MKLVSNKGFTVVELVFVLIIISVLAAVAVPKYTDLSGKSKDAAVSYIAGNINSGISLFYLTHKNSENLIEFRYPLHLDDASIFSTASKTNVFFDSVLAVNAIDENWRKDINRDVYIAPNQEKYRYDSETGKFELYQGPPPLPPIIQRIIDFIINIFRRIFGF
ncbi:type IV pilin protein [candidate division KSB1 bacterium]